MTKVSALIQISESKLSNIFIYIFQSTSSFVSKALAFALRAVDLFPLSFEKLGATWRLAYSRRNACL